MESCLLVSLAFFCLFSFPEASSASGNSDLDTYIVLLDKPEGLTTIESGDLHDWHASFLPESSFSSTQARMVHSYCNVITGFAAKLTPEEAKAMEQKEGFVSARVERFLSLHTTHTPEFLGLLQNQGNIWSSANFGRGVIIGLIDSGIKHDHPSFGDQGMPPPPVEIHHKQQRSTEHGLEGLETSQQGYDLESMFVSLEEHLSTATITGGGRGNSSPCKSTSRRPSHSSSRVSPSRPESRILLPGNGSTLLPTQLPAAAEGGRGRAKERARDLH